MAVTWDIGVNFFQYRKLSSVCFVKQTVLHFSRQPSPASRHGTAAEQGSAGFQATRPPQTAEQKLEGAPTNLHPKALKQTNHALPQTALFEDAIRERHLVPSPTAQSLPGGGGVSAVGG